MEDAHIAQFNIIPDVHIFGVFDGHGGIHCFIHCFTRGIRRLTILIFFHRQGSLAIRRKTFR